MLRIGFLPLQKALPDKPRNTREIHGKGQLSLVNQKRLRPGETQAGCTPAGAGRPWLEMGFLSPTPALPAQSGERGIFDVQGRQLREPDGVYVLRNGGSDCQTPSVIRRDNKPLRTEAGRG